MNEQVVLKRLNALRGIFAILIVIGHGSMRFEKEILPFFLIHKFNMVSVCFFLFVSGWGLAKSHQQKTNYLQGFLKSKAVYLALVAFLSVIVSAVITEPFIRGSLWEIFNLSGFFSAVNWYVWEAIFFYVVFWLVYKFIKSPRLRVWGIWGAAVFICLLSFYGGWTKAFYYSAFCFPLGICFHEYDISKELEKIGFWKIGGVLLALALLGCTSLLLPENSLLGGVVLRNLLGVSLMSLLALVVIHVKIGWIYENVLLRFLSKKSLEIYLYQFMILKIVRAVYEKYNFKIDTSYILFSVILTISMASIVQKMDARIKQKLMNSH